jgi:hypothetical protein
MKIDDNGDYIFEEEPVKTEEEQAKSRYLDPVAIPSWHFHTLYC